MAGTTSTLTLIAFLSPASNDDPSSGSVTSGHCRNRPASDSLPEKWCSAPCYLHLRSRRPSVWSHFPRPYHPHLLLRPISPRVVCCMSIIANYNKVHILTSLQNVSSRGQNKGWMQLHVWPAIDSLSSPIHSAVERLSDDAANILH